MKYKKGQKFYVEHQRKGGFYGEAIEDFETTEEFYPVKDLYDGEQFACRGSFCSLTPLSEEEFKRLIHYERVTNNA